MGLGQDQPEDGAATAGSVVAAAGNRGEKVMSVEEYEDCYVTEDGEIVPKDAKEQEAEAKRGPNAQEEVDIEAYVEETFVKARRAPTEPTEAERLRHEATHLPYRSWCEQCVRGRGRCKPHLRKAEREEESTITKVSMDFFFLGGEECDAKDNPMLATIDEESGNRYARLLESKATEGGENDWVIQDAVAELRSSGHTEARPLIIKCDGEHSMEAMRRSIAALHGGPATPEHPPKGKSQANGAVENARNCA